MPSTVPWHGLYDVAPKLVLQHQSPLAMFRDAVDRRGARPMMHYGDSVVTFEEVDRLSSALASALAGRQVRRADRVALYLQNGPQYVITLLACWKLGAIAVACNPMLKARELQAELRDAGATVLVTSDRLYAQHAITAVVGTAVDVTVVTGAWDAPADDCPEGAESFARLIAVGRGLELPTRPVQPDDIAVLTYTSGTTGPPKGAMNTHANVAFSSAVFWRWLHLDDDDVILALAPLFHVTGLVGHFGLACAAGVPMLLADRFNAQAVCRSIARHRATITIAPITAFIALAEACATARYDLSSLTKAYSGGAPVPAAAVAHVRATTGVVVRTAYGLTETTSPTHLTPLRAQAPVDPASGALAVGVPVFETFARVLDPEGREVPTGEEGEIAIRGPQVVPGYWRRPEQTRATMPGGELRTGDIGKIDEHGWLYVVDRLKDLIVASGYKVWPREVEDVLYEHPAVREAAVIGVPDRYRGETVHAVVSLRAGTSASPQELTDFCDQRLAAFKRPSLVTVVDELPKTASGKILRRELRRRWDDAQARSGLG